MDNLNKNKEDFLKQSKRFFDAGLMYVVYEDDDICICNVANQCYAAFDYLAFDGAQYGYLGGFEMAQRVIKNPSSLYDYILQIGEKDISNYLMGFNDSAFQVIQKIKLKNDVSGPTKSINYDFEKEAMELNNKKIKNKDE